MDKTYTQFQIEQAFLQWRKDWQISGRPLYGMPEEKDFASAAKIDTEYLISLINGTPW